MAKRTSVDKSSTINIKSVPVQGHIGASRFSNDDWKTIAFSFPRTELTKKFADRELRYNSIYFLFGYEDGHEAVYVGQALKRGNGESVLARLREHDESTTEKYRDKWTWVVVLTNEDDTWGSTELYALESIFINEVGTVLPAECCLNSRGQNNGGANYDLYKDKIKQIKALITSIGFKLFDDIADRENIQVTSVVKDFSVVEDLQNGMARIPEIVTPHRIVKAMVDMLPEEVWNSHTVFFDPACKGGEYLREIYDRLMETEILQSEFPNTIERSNHILKNQIFGIALSQVSLDRTSKKLLGEDRNIHIIPNYINNLRGSNMGVKPDGSQNSIQDILNKEFNRDMQIDVVIGNPPYQESTGSGLNENGGVALFDQFILNGLNITNRILCMITPTKWIAGNQSQFKTLRKALLDGDHLIKMVDYMNSKEVFHGRSIAGGVSYFLYDREVVQSTEFTTVIGKRYTSQRNMTKEGIIPRHAVGESVIEKIQLTDKEFISQHIFKNKWQLPTNFVGASDKKSSDSDIKIITPDKDYYVKPEEYNLVSVDKFKVMFTRVISEHAGEPSKQNTYKLLSSIRVLETNEICNASYMVIDGITKKEYAENIKAYMETKFVRFLILQALFGIGLTSEKFQFVPMQDFTKVWTDQMLYNKYGLTEDEVDFIENIMSPINDTSTIKLTAQDAMANFVNKQLQINSI